jgi:hypothetical protein
LFSLSFFSVIEVKYFMISSDNPMCDNAVFAQTPAIDAAIRGKFKLPRLLVTRGADRGLRRCGARRRSSFAPSSLFKQIFFDFSSRRSSRSRFWFRRSGWRVNHL